MNKLVCAAWLIAAACGKGSKDQAPPKPFEGPLTVAKVMAAEKTVKMFQAWDEAFAKLQGAVGPPTKVDGAKHYWAAMEGDDCAYFYVENENNKVGTIQSPMTVGKDGPIMNRAECLKLVGKGPAAEDPNAPGPRDGGPAYEVADVATQAVAARSKWTGKQIWITGNVTQMMGDEALLRDRVNEDVKLPCKLDAGATPPPMKQVVMQATVGIREFVRGTGEPGMDAELTKCSVVALDCKAKVAEMHAYFDLLKRPDGAKAKPWPTGDDKTDAAIKAFIDDFNKRMAKPGPKAAELGKGIKDTAGPLLKACPPALARYNEIAKTEGDRLAVIQSVGDKFAECDCKGEMGLWLARMYMAVLVSSGQLVDQPLRY